jgi:multiple antibiotic resistance protein
MTTVVLLMQQAEGEIVHQGVVLAVLVLVLALVLLGLLLATRMMRLIGVTGANVITRVLGVILGALAVQYVVDGIAGSFGSL